jgi:PleD family two-component response regulator
MANVLAFPRMPEPPDRPRRGPDRRAQSRGGRRADDKPGFAPLVLVVDGESNGNSRCEAILAKLHFAVAPAHDAAEAIRVMEALRPNIIVARIADAAAIRQATAADVPVVILSDDMADPEVLIAEIRKELSTRRRT